MSGTAANDSAGARSQLSTVTASLSVGLTLAFLLALFRNLPEAVLGAIVVHAVAHLADIGTLKYYAKLGTGNFVDVARHAGALEIPGLLIFRPNGVLFFANANRVYSRMRELVRTASPPIQAVIVNLEASPEIDVTCLEMLGELRNGLHKSGIRLYLARVTDPVHDLFERSGFLDQLDGLIFHGVDSAVSAFLTVRCGEPATSEVAAHCGT